MDIEKIATSTVIGRLSLCDGISPSITDGSSEPSWDGNICVYANDSKKKSELIARVPVQVKGKTANNNSAKMINFAVEVADLKNYLNDGGVIFFVVTIAGNGKQIYYNCLLPFDLKSIIEKVRKHTKKSIKLLSLPDDNLEIRRIILSFIKDRERQATKTVFTEEEMLEAVKRGASLTFHIQHKSVVDNPLEVMREATVQPFYMYVQTMEGFEIPFKKVEDVCYIAMRHKIDIPVYVGETKFYDHLYHGYENGKEYFYISDILRIPVADDKDHPQKNQFTYTIKGTLSRRTTNTEFLIALSQNKAFRIGNEIFHDVIVNNQEEVSRLRDINSYLKKIKLSLDYFGVKEELEMDGFSEVDWQNIKVLIHVAEGNEVSFVDQDLPKLIYSNMKIGNIFIRVLAKKGKNSNGYMLYSGFCDKAHITLRVIGDNEEMRIIDPWSLYLVMKAKDFLCSNIDYDIILESIRTMNASDTDISINWTESMSTNATNMFLEILRAYDSQTTKNIQLLQFAIDMADILLDEDPVSIINRLQAIRRKRQLTYDEIACLVNLRKENTRDKVIKCAASILLGEIQVVNALINELSIEEKKLITEYPIYTLYKQFTRLSQ